MSDVVDIKHAQFMQKFSDSEYHVIPSHTREALYHYIHQGFTPGGFLTAVLENNLSLAVMRADNQNALVLHEIVMFINNQCPSGCHGYAGVVYEWVTAFRAPNNN